MNIDRKQLRYMCILNSPILDQNVTLAEYSMICPYNKTKCRCPYDCTCYIYKFLKQTNLPANKMTGIYIILLYLMLYIYKYMAYVTEHY